MAAYHQMGHDSWNLISEGPLQNYAGVVLSPVNSRPQDVLDHAAELKGKDVILDPQLYKPSSDRGKLNAWPHFSPDVDTVNPNDDKWWDSKSKALCQVAQGIGAKAICSPAMLPKEFSEEYYRWAVDIADRAWSYTQGSGIDLLITAIAHLPTLGQKGRAEALAGILTSIGASRIYLVFLDEVGPRDQRTDLESLVAAGRLIRMLEESGSRVLVPFSGIDSVLWKAAGATDLATGKFFNLRRFVPGRWDEDAQEGGRVVPYWTDHDRLTWLREDDLRLLDKKKLFDRDAALKNPYGQQILGIIDEGKGTPWVGLGWRQYLAWFLNVETQLTGDRDLAASWLESADEKWSAVDASKTLLRDRTNTGEWVRPWRNVVPMFGS